MNDLLWVEKYRPRTVADCILPDEFKSTFQSYVDRKEIPHLLLCGGAGVGKTTIAKALCEQVVLIHSAPKLKTMLPQCPSQEQRRLSSSMRQTI
jgi:DNA polymerase III gamma/tau subunit